MTVYATGPCSTVCMGRFSLVCGLLRYLVRVPLGSQIEKGSKLSVIRVVRLCVGGYTTSTLSSVLLPGYKIRLRVKNCVGSCNRVAKCALMDPHFATFYLFGGNKFGA